MSSKIVIRMLCSLFMVTSPMRGHAQNIVDASPAPTIARTPQTTANVLDTHVSLDLHNTLLRVAVQAIADQAALRVAFGDVVDHSEYRVTLRQSNVTVREALNAVLRGTGIVYRVAGAQVILQRAPGASVAPAANGAVRGRVINAQTKAPLRGAIVQLEGRNIAVTADENGEYRLSGLSVGSHTIVARMLGFVRLSRAVVITEGQDATEDFALQLSANTLDQIVVTGTVIPTELKAVPNAMTVITAKDIERRGITRIDQLFRGDVPGLFAQNRGSLSSIDSATIFSRGATKLPTSTYNPATTPMKVYVDGVELASSVYLTQIDPQSIERIEILTGPQASTIYGSNAINGVIQIFTKRGNGVASRPQVTASLAAGLVQNDYTPSLAPIHDDAAQLNGVEGRISYNVGSSWNYIGAWTNSRRTGRLSSFGGARMSWGKVTTDGSWRIGNTHNTSTGTYAQGFATGVQTGQFDPSVFYLRYNRSTIDLHGNTYGVNLNVSPIEALATELGYGSDASQIESRDAFPSFQNRTDSNMTITEGNTARKTAFARTTLHVPITSLARLVVTVGADGWRTLNTQFSASGSSLIGTLPSPQISRYTAHNTGAFVQSQLGLGEDVFLTYGLRAEWNPNYGADALPNYAPRYGIAWTVSQGPVTAKLRGSYGKSTRPPEFGQKNAVATDPYYLPYYGKINGQLASPGLAPEDQQGAEGGLELYVTDRVTFVATRYNQTVDNLISSVVTDSVRSLTVDPYGYCSSNPFYCNLYLYYRQSQYLNIGTLRNQGWELQATTTLGPLSAKGTYSWTKSRMLGFTEKYRNQFPLTSYPMLRPGTPAPNIPEHTSALVLSYSNALTNVSLNMNHIGFFTTYRDAVEYAIAFNRLRVASPRVFLPPGYVELSHGYTMADVNASRRISHVAELTLQIQNLMNYYHNDISVGYPTIGRQSKAGVRVRW